jgi:hypothetical protein
MSLPRVRGDRPGMNSFSRSRLYSQKDIVTALRARWTTIRLAMEPRIVRLPEKVDAIASTFAKCAELR